MNLLPRKSEAFRHFMSPEMVRLVSTDRYYISTNCGAIMYRSSNDNLESPNPHIIPDSELQT